MSESNTVRQWPDNICFGPIRYARSSNYDGFYLADAMHGIPTFASVSPTEPVTIRGQHVSVFNYPGQTEQIAKQLVHRWNCFDDMLAALQGMVDAWDMSSDEGQYRNIWDAAHEAIAKAVQR